MLQTLNDLRLAVLIDADNIPYSKVREMLEEIAKYGTPTFKRIYGDWTNQQLQDGNRYSLRMPSLLFSNTVIQKGRIPQTLP
jgi:hypothetical protein